MQARNMIGLSTWKVFKRRATGYDVPWEAFPGVACRSLCYTIFYILGDYYVDLIIYDGFICIYSDGQILRTSFGKKSENRHSGDVLSMGSKKVVRTYPTPTPILRTFPSYT